MGVAGVALVLAALFLLTRTVQRSDDFDRLQDVILAINIAGGILLLLILIGNLWRLLLDYRENVPGAKLKARMVGMFVGLAVLPLIVVFRINPPIPMVKPSLSETCVLLFRVAIIGISAPPAPPNDVVPLRLLTSGSMVSLINP